MRKPLNQRLPRELKANAGKYICLFFMFTITILLGSSFIAVMDSAVTTLNHNQKVNLVEDGQIEAMIEIPDEVIADIEENEIQLFPEFYTVIDSYKGNAKINVFGQRKDCNLPSVFDGKLPENEKEIAIDRLFADNRDILIGDTVIFGEQDYLVTAVISLPDYNSLFKDNQDLVMNTMDFGVAVTTDEGFDRLADEGKSYRYVYRFEKRDLSVKEQQDIEKEVQKILMTAQVPLQSFLPQKNNQSIAFLVEDMGKDGPMMIIFIYILIAIIAFVFAVLTGNTIETEAAIIGTLRASGYKKSEIIAHYMLPTVLIAVFGSLVGNLIGYTLMLKPFEEMYYAIYCMPPMEIEFSMKALVLTTIIPVVIMLVMDYYMLANKLSLSPLKFLRKDLSKKHQKKAVKLPNFSFLHRFRLRVIIQNKGSFLILFCGIFLSSFLLMFGIGLDPLMDHYVDSIDDSLNYEYQYILKAPVEVDGGEKMELYGLMTWYPLGKKNIAVNFMGIVDDSAFFADEKIPVKEDEIIVTSPFAKKMGIDVGDEMEFLDEYRDKVYNLKVAGISEYEGTIGVFLSQKNLNELLGQDEETFNCYVSNEKLDIEKLYIAKYITRADMIGAASQMMDSFAAVIFYIKVFSVAIYMMLIYLLTKTVIEKNSLSISFMKVFGYNNREVGKLYLNATTITVFTSLVVCIPLEIASYKLTMVYLSSMIDGYMEYYAPWWVFVTIIITGVLAYLVINTLHVRRVRKIPMNEALKNRE